MKTAFCALMISLLCSVGPVTAQPPGYSSDSDNSGGSSARGNAKIALAWGEQLKPPAKYSRFIINLRDAMAKWGSSPVDITGQLRIGSPDLLKLTVLFISADEAFEINDTEKKNLQSFIAKGGLIVVDDAAASMPNSASAASLQKMIKQIAGSKRLEPVPNDHEIFNSPNALGGPPKGSDTAVAIVGEKVDASGASHPTGVDANNAGSLQGVFINGRLAILFCVKGYTPKWNANSDNDPQLKFGVNLITYGISTMK